MGCSLFDIQKAVDNVLINDATLLGLLGDGANSITDNPFINNPASPYIGYTENIHEPMDLKDMTGTAASLTLSIYQKLGNKSEIDAIMKRLNALLHNASLTITGKQTVSCRNEYSNILLVDQENGFVYQGVMRFRIKAFIV